MERLQQIEEIFQEALQRDPAVRDAYVREACHGDSDLRREVASLLANHDESFDSKPWAAAAAAQLIAEPASLKAGQRLGPYEIVAPIGAGGMGEVYKARDTRLKRDVAIKICSAHFSDRFAREARVIASLNHPNICQLYDVGPNYLVMELVEGENLSGPLPVETALNYARQIADALEAAHEKGIVHRDLKPGNVKITPAGVVKVLDFGLAKAVEKPATAGDPTNSPTLTMSPTRAGIIMGTAPYMSPEQERGALVDKRADIWAFGCVLYEMLTGKQAFHGEATSDILAAVLKEEPDWSRIPARVQPLLRRCLVRDPKHRVRDIGDAMPLLDSVPEAAPAQRSLLWVVVSAVLAVALAAVWFVHFRQTPAETPLLITSILPPENTDFDFDRNSAPALSPDGRRIVFGVREADGKTQLWMRPLDSPAAQPLTGTEGAWFPFWSPDSRAIAFFADGKLKRIDVAGGAARTVCDAPTAYGGSWSPQGVIVFAEGIGHQIQHAAAGGGVATPATTLDATHEQAHLFPWFLPDGRHFLFTVQAQLASADVTLRVGTLDSQEVKTIGPASFNTTYSSGYLLYLRGNTLVAQPFDDKSLVTTAAAAPIAEQLRTLFGGTIMVGVFSVSPEGLLAYRAGPAGSQQLTWFDRGGKPVGTLGDPGNFWSVEFSPDQKMVAVTRFDQKEDIWLYDVARGLPTRFTFSLAAEWNPVWSPDGRWIAYNSNVNGQRGLYRNAVDGTGTEELLAVNGGPSSWSPDGKFLLYVRLLPNKSFAMADTWVLPVGAPSGAGVSSKPFAWFATPFVKSLPKFSPDGRWVAYQSNETGRFEIYVAPFPGPGPKRQISTSGGGFVRWRADGKEIFYLVNGALMAAEVSIKTGSIEVGAIRSSASGWPLLITGTTSRPTASGSW
jgi:serine/threonine protein kinase